MKICTLALFYCSITITNIFSAYSQNSDRNYYQLKIYHTSKDQTQIVEKYLKTAYITALHKAGIAKIGVFKPIAIDTADQKIYVFIPFSSLDKFDKINETLSNDNQYQAAGKEYLEVAYNKAAYNRIESILLRAFPGMAQAEVPKLTAPKNERVYELRSYESASEIYSANKIKQFNEGSEITIFKQLNFNAVFYAEVLSGSRMPNLMYLTTFNNKADRDAHWQAFTAAPAWTTLKALPEYQHNTSKSDILFLYPVHYSDY
jgi:hypothetical protein